MRYGRFRHKKKLKNTELIGDSCLNGENIGVKMDVYPVQKIKMQTLPERSQRGEWESLFKIKNQQNYASNRS